MPFLQCVRHLIGREKCSTNTNCTDHRLLEVKALVQAALLIWELSSAVLSFTGYGRTIRHKLNSSRLLTVTKGVSTATSEAWADLVIVTGPAPEDQIVAGWHALHYFSLKTATSESVCECLYFTKYSLALVYRQTPHLTELGNCSIGLRPPKPCQPTSTSARSATRTSVKTV